VDLSALADKMQGYSGSDVRLLCKEAAMRPVRRLVKRLESIEAESGGKAVPEEKVQALIREDTVNEEDLSGAWENVKASGGSQPLERYEKWARECGST